MKKISFLLILIILSIFVVACNEKYPYTNKSDKKKMVKKAEYDSQVEGEIEKRISILTNLAIQGDKKAFKELEEWQIIFVESFGENFQF